MSSSVTEQKDSTRRYNTAPSGFAPQSDLPKDFMDFVLPFITL
jgi:hypothetical protein